MPSRVAKMRVVAADACAGARAEASAALPYENHSGLDRLAAEDLDAEELGVRVAAVARRAEAFLVRH